ncbi:MAG: hypothetical protein R6V49_08120 [Bacteroidales bacterium]
MQRSLFLFLLFLIAGGSYSTLNAQEPLTDFQKEQLRLQQLQTELLSARLSLLETRYEQLSANLSGQASDAAIQNLVLQIREIRDSLEMMNLAIWRLQAESAARDNLVLPAPVKSAFVPRQVMGLNPVRLFQGTFEMSGEWRLTGNWSGEAAVLGTYVTRGGLGGNYLKNQEFQMYDAALSVWKDYEGEMFSGYGFQLRGKNFLLNRLDPDATAPLGLYAGPVAMFRHIKIEGYQYVWDGQISEREEVTRHLDIGSLGITLGYQFPVHQVLAVDVFVGGVMRVSKYTNESQITRYRKWSNIDYSGVLPTAGIRIGILK